MRHAAVIAAAGLSSRMGQFKPLLPLGDTTVIGSVIRTLKSAGVGEIVVVCGRNREQMEEYLAPLGVQVCFNADFALTDMFRSICLGLAALSVPYEKVFLTPGDVPLVSSSTLDQLCRASGKIVRPLFQGQPGHPVLLDGSLIPSLLSYCGPGGLGGFLETCSGVTEVEVEDAGILVDLDTPEDYEKARKK